MVEPDWRERQRAVGFLPYWEALNCFSIIDGNLVVDAGWGDQRIVEGFRDLGYVVLDFDMGGPGWVYGESAVDDLIDHLHETDRVFSPWSAIEGLAYRKMWFSNEHDAIIARLVVVG